jgi:F-type H+-transporting ATPase subunit epsilon
MAVNSGFAEVSGDRVSIIVDSAENASEIDVKRAQAALERAKKRLEQVRHDDDIDSLRAESALKRAISRLKVVKKGL